MIRSLRLSFAFAALLCSCRGILGIEEAHPREDAGCPADASCPPPKGGIDLDASTCESESVRCSPSEPSVRERCSDGVWRASEACAEGTICDLEHDGQCRPADCDAGGCGGAAPTSGSGGAPPDGMVATAGTGGQAAGGGAAGSGNSGVGGGGSGGQAGMPTAGNEACDVPGKSACVGVAGIERKRCEPTTRRWTADAACTAGQLCDRADASCKPIVAVCIGRMPGDVVCDGTDRHACGPDLVTSEVARCASAAHCMQAQGKECAQCIDGEHRCQGARLGVCNSTHDGFAEVMVCATESLCNAGAGQCTSAACVAGQHRCTGDTLQVCNDARTGFTNKQTCQPALCDAIQGQCDVCSGDTCTSRGVRGQCSNDRQRVDTMACPANTPICVGSGNCVQCAESADCAARECQVAQCQINQCNYTPAASTVTCSRGHCDGTGRCVQCTQVADCPAPATCTVATCNANACGTMPAGAGVACTGGVCNGAGQCGVCVPAAMRCNANQPQQCSSAGQWQNLGSACGTEQLCRDGQCVANPPFVRGNPNPLTMNSAFLADTIYGVPFTVDGPTRVLGLGVVARDSSGRFVQMGVYDTMSEMPRSLLGRTSEAAVVQGSNEYAPTSVLSLPAAGTYMIAATFSGAQNSFIDVDTQNRSTLVTAPYAALPLAFPMGSSPNLIVRNLFVRLQTLP